MKKIFFVFSLILFMAGGVSAEYANIKKIELNQSTGGIGQPITITVTADGTNVKYRYWVNTADFNTHPDSPHWVLLQDWTTSNTYTWTPTATGLHTIVVWVSCNTGVSACNIIGLGYNVTQGTQPPPPTQYLSDKLFGYWHFWYTITSTWHQYYDLSKREGLNPQGDYYVSGTDQLGDIVLATYFPDDENFALLDPGILFDRFYIFDLNASGDTITTGTYCQVNPDTGEIISNLYPLSGTKIHSNPVRSMQTDDQLAIETLEKWEAEESKKAEGESNRSPMASIELDIHRKYLELREAIETK